jgi:hypothetical protein
MPGCTAAGAVMEGAVMTKGTVYKLVVAAVFLFLTIGFMAVDNEAVWPSTMLGFFLILTLFGTGDLRQSAAGTAAHRAVGTFAILVMVLNTAVTILLPMVGASEASHAAVEMTTSIGTTDPEAVGNHFIAVTINDMHELCFSTSVLLIINAVYLLVSRRRRPVRA